MTPAQLRAAQARMLRAQKKRDAARRAYRAATAEVKASVAHRRDTLHAALDAGVPEKTCAEALGISVPRVYQITREYPK